MPRLASVPVCPRLAPTGRHWRVAVCCWRSRHRRRRMRVAMGVHEHWARRVHGRLRHSRRHPGHTPGTVSRRAVLLRLVLVLHHVMRDARVLWISRSPSGRSGIRHHLWSRVGRAHPVWPCCRYHWYPLGVHRVHLHSTGHRTRVHGRGVRIHHRRRRARNWRGVCPIRWSHPIRWCI